MDRSLRVLFNPGIVLLLSLVYVFEVNWLKAMSVNSLWRLLGSFASPCICIYLDVVNELVP